MLLITATQVLGHESSGVVSKGMPFVFGLFQVFLKTCRDKLVPRSKLTRSVTVSQWSQAPLASYAKHAGAAAMR